MVIRNPLIQYPVHNPVLSMLSHSFHINNGFCFDYSYCMHRFHLEWNMQLPQNTPPAYQKECSLVIK